MMTTAREHTPSGSHTAEAAGPDCAAAARSAGVVSPAGLIALAARHVGGAPEAARLTHAVAGRFRCAASGRDCAIDRFHFFGPSGEQTRLRIGCFAVLHGDEPAGALALEQLLAQLADDPAAAAGYELIVYPVCNPTGLEDGTRLNRAGLDLNREFWRGSTQPEVQILERELRTERFDGIVVLHADDTSDGLYGYAHGRLLNEQLLRPALRQAARVLPINAGRMIDGFTAEEGVISDCFHGILAPPPEARPRPFEIIFETPALAPMTQQAEAACCAVRALLLEYRAFIAQGINL